jgi:hypothetical protein
MTERTRACFAGGRLEYKGSTCSGASSSTSSSSSFAVFAIKLLFSCSSPSSSLSSTSLSSPSISSTSPTPFTVADYYSKKSIIKAFAYMVRALEECLESYSMGIWSAICCKDRQSQPKNPSSANKIKLGEVIRPGHS